MELITQTLCIPDFHKEKGRLDFIDLAKGFGMLMVIYLHITINYPPIINVYAGTHWEATGKGWKLWNIY